MKQLKRLHTLEDTPTCSLLVPASRSETNTAGLFSTKPGPEKCGGDIGLAGDRGDAGSAGDVADIGDGGDIGLAGDRGDAGSAGDVADIGDFAYQ